MLKMNLHIKGETMNNDHPEAAINLSVSIYFILLSHMSGGDGG